MRRRAWDFNRLPPPAKVAALDVSEARKRREVECEDKCVFCRGGVEKVPLRCCRKVPVLVPHGMPIGMLEMDRVKRRIRHVEKPLAVRLHDHGEMPRGVPGRRQYVDTRRDLDVIVEEVNAILDGQQLFSSPFAEDRGKTRKVRLVCPPRPLLPRQQVPGPWKDGRSVGRRIPADVVGVRVRQHDRVDVGRRDPGPQQVREQVPHARIERPGAGVDEEDPAACLDQEPAVRRRNRVRPVTMPAERLDDLIRGGVRDVVLGNVFNVAVVQRDASNAADPE